jgi:hypothetical protein
VAGISISQDVIYTAMENRSFEATRSLKTQTQITRNSELEDVRISHISSRAAKPFAIRYIEVFKHATYQRNSGAEHQRCGGKKTEDRSTGAIYNVEIRAHQETKKTLAS